MKRLVIVGLMAVATTIANAAEITFTDAMDDQDIANPKNWPNETLPTSEDVAIVPIDAGKTVYCKSDVSFKGLRIQNAGSFTLGDTTDRKTITLGSEGFQTTVNSENKGWNMGIRPHFVTTCDQTWNIDPGYYSTATLSGKITGTHNLTIKGSYSVKFTNDAVGYDGHIELARTRSNVAFFYISGTGQYATSLKVNFTYLFFQFTGAAYLKDIIPSGQIDSEGWNSGYGVDGTATELICDDGASIQGVGDGNELIAGTLRIVSGNYRFNKWTTAMYATSGFKLLMEGGTYNPYALFMSCDSATTPALFQQTGGNTPFSNDIEVGGAESNLYPASPAGLAWFRLMGGTSSVSASYPIRIAGNAYPKGHTNADDCSPGYLSIEGGKMTSARGIIFGGVAGSAGRAASYSTNHFGFFDMRGGKLVSSANWLRIADTWNANSDSRITSDNAVASYRVVLRGGTNELTTPAQTMKLQCEIQPGTQPLVINNANAITMNAPVWGTGALTKDGAGSLVLKDAARFSGSLTVKNGSVDARGTLNYDAVDEGCVIWRADDIDQEDGSDVTNWTTSVGAEYKVSSVKGEGYYAPTLAKNAMNGHAAVYFQRRSNTKEYLASSETLAANPLYNETNVTIAVVIKTEGDGSGGSSDWDWYYQTFIVGNPTRWSANSIGITYKAGGQICLGNSWCNRNSLDNRVFETYQSPQSAYDSKVHVVVATRKVNVVSLNVDGIMRINNHTDIPYQANNYPLYNDYPGAAQYSRQFMVGYGFQETKCFKGYISEIRVYKNKILTPGERNVLVESLMNKYRGDEGVTLVRSQCNSSIAGSYDSVASTDAPAGGEEWLADDISVADGAAVSSWTGSGDTTAAAVGTAPTMKKGVLNGKSFVSFAGDGALVIPAASSPTAGKSAFTVAVAFRTTTDGTTSYKSIREVAEGIVGARASTKAKGANDWALSWQKYGTVASQVGSTAADSMIFRRKPCMLADGVVHVAVMTVDITNGRIRQMVDGYPYDFATTSTGARSATDLAFGAIANGSGYFTGDIGAVRIYDRALSASEMMAVTKHYLGLYKALPLARFPVDTPAYTGIGVTNVVVKSGAKMVFGENYTNPFTLKRGGSVTVEAGGTIDGTVRYMDGAVFDSTKLLGTFNDVWLANGSVVKADGVGLALPRLKLSGTIKVDTAALGDTFRNVPLLSVPAAELDETGVTFESADETPIRVDRSTSGWQLTFTVSKRLGSVFLIR